MLAKTSLQEEQVFRPERAIWNGPQLRQDRVASGYTQAELAELSGLETVTYSNYERGDVVPNVEDAVNIACVLGYYVDRYLKFDVCE